MAHRLQASAVFNLDMGISSSMQRERECYFGARSFASSVYRSPKRLLSVRNPSLTFDARAPAAITFAMV
jgi:hypothetical protein